MARAGLVQQVILHARARDNMMHATAKVIPLEVTNIILNSYIILIILSLRVILEIFDAKKLGQNILGTPIHVPCY